MQQNDRTLADGAGAAGLVSYLEVSGDKIVARLRRCGRSRSDGRIGLAILGSHDTRL